MANYSRGTVGYRAPEPIQYHGFPNKYTNKVDIWALGCILYELVLGKQAFRDDLTVIEYHDRVSASGEPLQLTFEHEPFHLRNNS
jgi:serine/threonine protein kinase